MERPDGRGRGAVANPVIPSPPWTADVRAPRRVDPTLPAAEYRDREVVPVICPDRPWKREASEPSEIVRELADRVAAMIVTSSYSDLECAIAEREARMECLRLLPEKMDLFDLIYTARFRRLREQFRA